MYPEPSDLGLLNIR